MPFRHRILGAQCDRHVVNSINWAQNESAAAASLRLVLRLSPREVFTRSRFITMWRTTARLLAAKPVRTIN